jgi:hypothetical protein
VNADDRLTASGMVIDAELHVAGTGGRRRDVIAQRYIRWRRNVR